MNAPYHVTTSLCPTCARDVPGTYRESRGAMILDVECPEHGVHTEVAEADAAFFRRWYEDDYPRPYRHLVLPLTYRCGERCRYCYTLSNTGIDLPADRPAAEICRVLEAYDGNSTLIGGEPTLRTDLTEIIGRAKASRPSRRVGLGTNGRRLADPAYLGRLRDAGLDYVFLSVNDPAYEVSEQAYAEKLRALDNCRRSSTPVWLQRTVDDLRQLDSLPELISRNRRVVFNVTVRAARDFGAGAPPGRIHVSEMVARLGVAEECRKGYGPFNNLVTVARQAVKVCSWGNDMSRLDPIDIDYLISNDTMTTFHRGMRVDEVLLAGRAASPPRAEAAG